MNRLLSGFIFAAALLIASISHAQPFTFTAIPDQDESHLQERFNKIAVYLRKAAGYRGALHSG